MVAVMKSAKGAIRHRFMQTIEQLKAGDRSLVSKAVQLAEEAHDGQFRFSTREGGRPDPYVVHPLKVAFIALDELGMKEADALCIAILHDVLEAPEHSLSAADIEYLFGRSIALAVSILTKPKPDMEITRQAQLATYYDRVKQAQIITRLIFLADRLDNMRDAVNLFDEEMQGRLLAETVKHYLPIAEETDQYLFAELASLCHQLVLTAV